MPGEILPTLLLREAAQARTWEDLVLLRTHCRWQRSQARVTMKDPTGFKSWLCSLLCSRATSWVSPGFLL